MSETIHKLFHELMSLAFSSSSMFHLKIASAYPHPWEVAKQIPVSNTRSLALSKESKKHPLTHRAPRCQST